MCALLMWAQIYLDFCNEYFCGHSRGFVKRLRLHSTAIHYIFLYAVYSVPLHFDWGPLAKVLKGPPYHNHIMTLNTPITILVQYILDMVCPV